MKTLSPRLRRLTELPGPVWLFCALCLSNIYNWVLQVGTQFCDGRLHADSTGIIAAIWFSSLLHMIFCGVLIWGYVARKHFAVPLSAWYTGFILIQHFIGLLASFFNRDYFTYFSGPVFTQTFSSLFWGVLCFAYLRYLERSETMARLYPRADRKVGWWVVVLLLFAQMNGLVDLWKMIHP